MVRRRMTTQQRDLARRTLSNLLSSRLKADNEPASADMHMCSAIVGLLELCDGWRPTSCEMLVDIEYAMEVVKSLRGD